MQIYDFFTRVPIWLALACYAVTVFLFSRHRLDGAKWAWSLGCLFYLIHVFAAFHVHYQWSHEIAVEQTAIQTEQATSIRTNSGIYVNYVFTLIWMIDAVWWWRVGSSRYSNRHRWCTITLHLFFVFMIFNGAVVFASGPARWIGVGVLAVAIVSWLSTRFGRQATSKRLVREKTKTTSAEACEESRH